jgi:hypothetical protein
LFEQIYQPWEYISQDENNLALCEKIRTYINVIFARGFT